MTRFIGVRLGIIPQGLASPATPSPRPFFQLVSTSRDYEILLAADLLGYRLMNRLIDDIFLAIVRQISKQPVTRCCEYRGIEIYTSIERFRSASIRRNLWNFHARNFIRNELNCKQTADFYADSYFYEYDWIDGETFYVEFFQIFCFSILSILEFPVDQQKLTIWSQRYLCYIFGGNTTWLEKRLLVEIDLHSLHWIFISTSFDKS